MYLIEEYLHKEPSPHEDVNGKVGEDIHGEWKRIGMTRNKGLWKRR